MRHFWGGATPDQAREKWKPAEDSERSRDITSGRMETCDWQAAARNRQPETDTAGPRTAAAWMEGRRPPWCRTRTDNASARRLLQASCGALDLQARHERPR